MPPPLAHAVFHLRAARLARSTKPFLARGGSQRPRCVLCRLPTTHCLCAWRPSLPARAGVCLLMGDTEPLKPSNTGWLVADVVPDTFAFGWARTETDPAFLALLQDPQWQAWVVFPGAYAAPERVVQGLAEAAPAFGGGPRRPLFILLDGTWAEARKMFRKTPCLDALPVLSLHPERVSQYRLRHASQSDHLCTSEVAALCLALAGETQAADVLGAYLDVFNHHHLQANRQCPVDVRSPAHLRLRGLMSRC